MLSVTAPTFTRDILDPTPSNAGSGTLEKAMIDINGDGNLDAVLGESNGGFNVSNTPGGMFWYQAPSDGNPNEAWVKHTIVATGSFYESCVGYDVNGDGAADIIASDNDQLVWFENPRGSGGDDTLPWTMHVINPNGGAHDLRLADIDGDGRMDVVCSGSAGLGTQGFISFQNPNLTWTNVNVATLHEGISTLDIGSGLGAVNIVGVDSSDNVSWWENPREHGGNARTGAWTQHIIANVPGGDGATIASGVLDSTGRMDIVVASNEEGDDIQGLVFYSAPVDRRAGTSWVMHTVDASYRDVHQINIADLNNDGTQDIVVGEQEQAATSHPGTPSRLTVFYNDGNASFVPSVLSTTGIQNQVVGDVEGDGDLDILGANHGVFGAPNPLELWVNHLDPTINLVQNPGLESGTLAPWSLEGTATAGIDSDPTHSHAGNDSASISAANGFADLAQTVTVKPNRSYTFTAWVDASSTSGGKLAVKTAAGTDLGSTPLANLDPGPTTNAADYQQYTVTFNSGSNTSVMVYAGYIGSGSGDPAFLNLDDAQLITTPPPPTGPAILVNPVAQSIIAGQPGSLTASASGSPPPSVQWQVSTDGGATFNNIAGATTNVYTFTAALGQNNNQYHAVFTNSTNSATTNNATLTVIPAPIGTFINTGGSTAGIYLPDADFTGGNTFLASNVVDTSADLTAAPQSVYQTERYGNFTYTIPNLVAGNTYSVRLHFAEIYWTAAGKRLFNVSINGQQVLNSFDIYQTAGGNKAIVQSFNTTADSGGKITIVFTGVRDTAKVSAIDVVPAVVVPAAPSVTANPQNQNITAGQTATFTAAASGTPTPTVQWQVSTDGGASFSNIAANASATTTTLTLPGASTTLNGTRYQAVFTNASNSATTNPATLSVAAAPVGTFIDAGGPTVGSYLADAYFSGGSAFSKSNTIDTSADPTAAPQSVYQTERYGNFTYTVPNLVAGNAYSVRLHFAEIYWTTAGKRLFNVSINGQQVLNSFDIFQTAGANKAVVQSFNTTADSGGKITIAFTSVADNAKVSAIDVVPTVVTPTPPSVTSNPQNQNIIAGQTATFTAAASGFPTPTVQWQVSIDGGSSFSNITANASATTTTLTLPGASTTLSGTKYQAVFTNASNSATSGIATLTVGAAPVGAFIRAGGAAVGSYLADTYFSGGTGFSTSNAVDTSADPTAAPQAVYQTERYGNFTYTVPNLVAGNTYSVRLHFAEIYWTAAGKRTFNASINGLQVLTSFDIFQVAGANKAVVQSFNAIADANGKITITFTSVKDNAKVSAIDVVPT